MRRRAADLLGRAADVGARPILVTDGLSVVTEAFRQALLDAGGAWVVRGDDGLRNGLDGRRLDAFPDAVRTGPPRSVDEVAVSFLRPVAPTADQLVVSVSVRHRAAAETVLGTTSELLATELAGAAPTGWGTHEPAGRPWDRRTLTEAARDRMPDPTRFVVVGSAAAPVAFTVTAQRTDQGVEELTTGLLSVGAPGTRPPPPGSRPSRRCSDGSPPPNSRSSRSSCVARVAPTSRRRRACRSRRSRWPCSSGRPPSGSSGWTPR